MSGRFESANVGVDAMPGQRQRGGLSRRALLTLGSLMGAALATKAASAPTATAPVAGTARSIQAPESRRQIHSGGPSGRLAVGAGNAPWALALSGAAAIRLASDHDPLKPLSVGHSRMAARHADERLWLWQGNRVRRGMPNTLAPQAGLWVLPLALIGVAAGSYRVLRLEPDAKQSSAEAARSTEPVLPDDRPLQADLDARGDKGGGHLVLMADAPDGQRYAHVCRVPAWRRRACFGSSSTAWKCCANWRGPHLRCWKTSRRGYCA